MDARVRGNAHQLLEKYRNMARDATLAGDRITAEYYFQYADHYYRVLNENRPRFEDNRARQRDDWREREESGEDESDERGLDSPRAEAAERADPVPARFARDEAGHGDGRRTAVSARGDAVGGIARDARDEDGEAEAGADMIPLSVLPPAISRPVDAGRAAGPDAQDAPADDAGDGAAPVRRGRRLARTAAEDVPADAATLAAPAPAPRKRGRPPKPRPESAQPEFEEV